MPWRPNKPSYRYLTPAEKAWVAGYLEGEGSFVPIHTSPGRGRDYVRVSAASVDRDVLERLQEITGVGRIYLKAPACGNRKECWSWHVARRADVLAIMSDIAPLMCARRQARIYALLRMLRYGWETPETSSTARVQEIRAAVAARWGADSLES